MAASQTITRNDCHVSLIVPDGLEYITDDGGIAITASQTMTFDGHRVARKGDEVTCPLDPEIQPNLIIEGDDKITDHGVPVARHGHRQCAAAC